MIRDLHQTIIMNLTKKEAQVFALILEGKSNQEIANELFTSINTTKTHVAHILKKKKAKKKKELIQNEKQEATAITVHLFLCPLCLWWWSNYQISPSFHQGLL